MEPTKLFLDLDGVLADFDRRATDILGMTAANHEFKYGHDQTWSKLDCGSAGFFAGLKLMPDADHLWLAVRDLRPTILTALPRDNPERTAAEKREWVARHLGADVSVITCRGHEKPNYCTTWSILVDDRNMNEKAWLARGGIFIHHHSANQTINALKDLAVWE